MENQTNCKKHRLIIIVLAICCVILLTLAAYFAKSSHADKASTAKLEAALSLANLNYQRSEIDKLRHLIYETKLLVLNWVKIEKESNTADKQYLLYIHEKAYPQLHQEISSFQPSWTEEENQLFQYIGEKTTELIDKHKLIMFQLNDVNSYNHIPTLFNVDQLIDNNGEIISLTNDIIEKIDMLLKLQDVKLTNSTSK